MIAAAIALLSAFLPMEGQAQNGQALISYGETVRCAGLTQAASELEGGESDEGRRLFDAALYWTLAAMQAAQTSGRDTDLAEAEQIRSRVDSVRRLNSGDVETRAALLRCRSRTPDLG